MEDAEPTTTDYSKPLNWRGNYKCQKWSYYFKKYKSTSCIDYETGKIVF
jgi:hypothetical protein